MYQQFNLDDTPAEIDFNLEDCMYALKYSELEENERDNLTMLVNVQLATYQGWKIIPFLSSFKVLSPFGFEMRLPYANSTLHEWHSITKSIPNYIGDANAAMSLFAPQKDVRLRIEPMGFDNQWKVGYEVLGNIYLPGSGSYYDLPEAIVRAFVAYLNDPTLNS